LKRLILCCDGTWNRADQARHDVPCPTNVVGTAFRIAKRAGESLQIIYYDQGVGTGNLIDRLSGGAFGEGLADNIYDAYRFLIANYESGDEVFLFGFSRGAFTIRSLGGLIRKCGILKRDAVGRYREALQLYRREDCHPDDELAVEFRRQYSVTEAEDIPLRFVGVWDTVGALGIPLRGLRGLTRRKYLFHDTRLSRCVRSAYHALAIDEHRGPFEATLWEYLPKEGQTIEQVWFCGAHSDVGGGYAEHGLSDIALQWMLEKAKACGLALDDVAMRAYPLQPDDVQPIHNSMRLWYRLAPSNNRSIGLVNRPKVDPKKISREPDPTQSIHESVLRRWDADKTYRPKSLLDYFRRQGDPRVSSS
jgi:uncharacterized protein (DUF2235 family)